MLKKTTRREETQSHKLNLSACSISPNEYTDSGHKQWSCYVVYIWCSGLGKKVLQRNKFSAIFFVLESLKSCSGHIQIYMYT